MSTRWSRGLWLHLHSLSQTGKSFDTLSTLTLNNPFSSPMFTFSNDDWTEGYAAQPNGYDQTLHVAAASGSRVSFNLAGTFSWDFRVPLSSNTRGASLTVSYFPHTPRTFFRELYSHHLDQFLKPNSSMCNSINRDIYRYSLFTLFASFGHTLGHLGCREYASRYRSGILGD
jgi:hypothetical protein